MHRWALLATVAACNGPRAPAVAPAAGVSIAVYAGQDRTQAVIDDRRAIDVTGRRVVLEGIAPTAELSTLWIESLGGRALAFEQCARTRLPLDEDPAEAAAAAILDPAAPRAVMSPLVECAVRGAPGRYFVRVHYTARHFPLPRIRHEIAAAAPDKGGDARATIATRFVMDAPAWGTRAEIAFFRGLPGGSEPPREVVRGRVVFDGSHAILQAPPREVPARLVHLFQGVVPTSGADSIDDEWGLETVARARVMLELDDAQLLPAAAHVRVTVAGEPRDSEVVYAPQGAPSATARLALWVDPLVVGTRRAILLGRTNRARATDVVAVSVRNWSEVQREVWVEEPLRAARERKIARPDPETIRRFGIEHDSAPLPEIVGDVARAKLVLAPHTTAYLAFAVQYKSIQPTPSSRTSP